MVPPGAAVLLPERVCRLRAVPWLRGLPGELLIQLARGAEFCHARRSREVLHWLPAGAQPGILIVLRGQLRVERSAGAAIPLLKRRLVAFDTHGEDGLLLGEACADRLVSLGAVEAVHLDAVTVSRALAQSADLRLALMSQMTRKLRQANARIRMLALHTVKQRLWQVLHDWASLDGAHGPEVLLRHRVTELAAATAASRSAVSRALKQFEASGLVRYIGGHRIVLLQPVDVVVD